MVRIMSVGRGGNFFRRSSLVKRRENRMQLNPVSLDVIAEAREEAHAVLATLMARLAPGEHVVRLGVDMEGQRPVSASWAGSAADRPPPCGRHSRSPFRFPRARSDPGHPLRGEKRNKGGKLILCCAAPRALPFMVGRFFMKGTVWV